VHPYEPEYWFLGNAEQPMIPDLLGNQVQLPVNQLLPCRAASWKTQNEQQWGIADVLLMIRSYTSGNRVTVFVDGDSYLRSLQADLQVLPGPRTGSFVLVTGWQFSNGFRLGQGNQARTLAQTVRDLALRAVELRALPYANPILFLSSTPFVAVVNDAYPATDQSPGRSGQADAPPGFAYSHHQKEVFLGATDFANSAAYVGGIDLADDRWDDTSHTKTEKDFEFYGWHDIQLKVEGNALHALWANFAERWGSADRLLGKDATRLRPCPVPQWTDSRPGTHHVQVLRTVSPSVGSDPGRFMRYGELTVLAGLAKAIRNAECYIYIEEQYLWDCELAELIRDQLQAKSTLRLIVVLAAESSLPPGLWKGSYHLRSQFFMRLLGVTSKNQIRFGPTTRVYVYGLYQTKVKSPKAIYVHSKLVIIDDRYVAVGSANVDKRSMRIETELTVAVVDDNTAPSTLGGTAATVCRFAQDLRIRLWAEHLDLDPSDTRYSDPVEMLKAFPGTGAGTWQPGAPSPWPTDKRKARKTAKHHTRCYINISGGNPGAAVLRILDRGERRWRSGRAT
jgi:phosphatidylserine/phosphatidylglycerophosphate/cardiolipin synthase-like enzyme